MSRTADPLRSVLSDTLRQSGFVKKGPDWYRKNAELVEVVNLQKSQFGQQYFLNYALWLYALGDSEYPKEHHCHLRARAEQVAADRRAVELLLDLDASCEQRSQLLVGFLNSEFLPFADGCRTLVGLRALIREGRLKGAFMTASARALLLAGT